MNRKALWDSDDDDNIDVMSTYSRLSDSSALRSTNKEEKKPDIVMTFDDICAKMGMSKHVIESEFRNADTRAKHIELLPPLLRPYGCGPIAPKTWWTMQTYAALLETRDETRMGPGAMACGDRTVKRCYMRACQGAPDFERIRACFHSLMTNTHWHQILLPFGIILFEQFEVKQILKDLVMLSTKRTVVEGGQKTVPHFLSPYSVGCNDVLYLCNTSGYMERYMFVLATILWAKMNGVNLLICNNGKGKGKSKTCTYVTYERHLYLFGSIIMTRRVIEANRHDVGGNWIEYLDMLQRMENDLMTAFNVDKYCMHRLASCFIVDECNNIPEGVKTHLTTMKDSMSPVLVGR